MNKVFVFDTNVLISSLLLKQSINFKALNLAMKIGSVVSTQETFKEFKNCLLRPKFDPYLTIEKRLYDLVEIESSVCYFKEYDDTLILSEPSVAYGHAQRIKIFVILTN